MLNYVTCYTSTNIDNSKVLKSYRLMNAVSGGWLIIDSEIFNNLVANLRRTENFNFKLGFKRPFRIKNEFNVSKRNLISKK